MAVYVTFEDKNQEANFSKELNKVKEDREFYNWRHVA